MSLKTSSAKSLKKLPIHYEDAMHTNFTLLAIGAIELGWAADWHIHEHF